MEMNFVGVCVLSSAERRREERREKINEMVACKYGRMHGRPLSKNEVAHTKSTPPSLWAWAENGEGKEKELGLECLAHIMTHFR